MVDRLRRLLAAPAFAPTQRLEIAFVAVERRDFGLANTSMFGCASMRSTR